MPVALVDQLQNFSDFLWREQNVALRAEAPKLNELHLAFMRRAWRNGRVSYDRMLHDTGLSSVMICRAGEYLRKHKLAKLRSDPSDKRRRFLKLTEHGRARLVKIETTLAARVMTAIEADDFESLRLFKFVKYLWTVNSFLKPSRVTNLATYDSFPLHSTRKRLPSDHDPNVQIVLLNEPLGVMQNPVVGFD